MSTKKPIDTIGFSPLLGLQWNPVFINGLDPAKAKVVAQHERLHLEYSFLSGSIRPSQYRQGLEDLARIEKCLEPLPRKPNLFAAVDYAVNSAILKEKGR